MLDGTPYSIHSATQPASEARGIDTSRSTLRSRRAPSFLGVLAAPLALLAIAGCGSASVQSQSHVEIAAQPDSMPVQAAPKLDQSGVAPTPVPQVEVKGISVAPPTVQEVPTETGISGIDTLRDTANSLLGDPYENKARQIMQAWLQGNQGDFTNLVAPTARLRPGVTKGIALGPLDIKALTPCRTVPEPRYYPQKTQIPDDEIVAVQYPELCISYPGSKRDSMFLNIQKLGSELYLTDLDLNQTNLQLRVKALVP